MYQRKTRDVWCLMSNYGYGWECELTETTKADAMAQMKCYKENCPGASYKVVKKRERVER